MGFIRTLFGKNADQNTNTTKVPWVALDNLDLLDVIEKASHEKPQLIFKHSTTCGISRMVLNMFTVNYSFEGGFETYFLDLHAYRNVSNGVAEKFGVMHQSPQLLIIKDGQVEFHASHGAISDTDLGNFL